MVKLITSLLTLLTAVAVSAAPLTVEARADVAPRQSCTYVCGNNCYSASDVQAALDKGYSLEQSGQQIRSYPHQYKDYEGFNLPTSGPWYEFPIMASGGVYRGGSPGPDRVIFDGNGNLDALVTHSGASGNNFVLCQGN